MDLTKIPFWDPLTLKFYNPLFNEIGDHSLPISFNTKIPSIRRAFGFPESLNINSVTSIPGKINTQLLDLEGTWQVKEASDDIIEVYFKGNGGNFYSLIRDIKLNMISYGGIKYPCGTYGTPEEVYALMNSKMNASYPDDEYAVFCAYLPNAYGDDTIDSAKLVNDVTHDELGVPTLSMDFETPRNDTIYLFAATVIDYLFSEFGYKIGKNIFRENNDLRHLVIFNTYNRLASPSFDYSKLVPQILCSDFLKAITNRFNIAFYINEKSKTVDIISFDTLVSSGVKSLSTKFISNPKINNNRITGLSFAINAPDTWSDHKIKGMIDFPLCSIVTVNKFTDIVPSYATLLNIFNVKAENTWYKIVRNEFSAYNAERICTSNFPYIEGSAPTEVTQYSGIPAMFRYEKYVEWESHEEPPPPSPEYTYAHMVMPRCDMECTDINSPGKEFPLMFLFSRGIQDSYIIPELGAPTVMQYPLGSNDIYDALGNVITGAILSLNWQESNGIIGMFWERRLDWELNIKKLVTGLLTINDINKLIDFSMVIRIQDNNYLVNKVEAEITPRNIRITDAELFRL